jgi:hypothetical protein
MKSQKSRKNFRKNKRMQGGNAFYAPSNSQLINNNGAPIDNIGKPIAFNTSTGGVGVDPLAPANIIDSRLIPQQRGGKKSKGKNRFLSKRNKKNLRKTRGQKIRGGLGFSSLGAIPDFFLGPRTSMNQVSSFGSTAGGMPYAERQLTGKGNLDGPSLLPDMGPPSQAKV